jgi:hypothetical protein
MNRDIMSVVNELVYDRQLRCGDARVEASRLVLPKPERLDMMRMDPITGGA